METGIYESDYWRLHVPPGWEWEESDDDEASVTFFRPGGAGVLAISCSEKDDGLVGEDDLEHFAAELLEAGLTPARASIGHLHGLLFEHVDGGEYWREWYMAADDLFFYITYNCPPDDRDRETGEVLHLLHTIEIND